MGIIWTIILLSNTLSIKKFFQNDFDDNSLIIVHMSGLSYEIIALIKMLTIWMFLQAPFFIILPIAFLLLEMQFDNLKIVYLSFLIGSVIITCISAISGSMNLLNKRDFSIGGLIIMILSIPVIIFGVIFLADRKLKMSANKTPKKVDRTAILKVSYKRTPYFLKLKYQ